jgi:hypothetical protein
MPGSNGSAAHPTVSIVVPTYNPQDRIFRRVLAAIEVLCRDSRSPVECVIVDNKSDPPVQERQFVQQFLARVPSARIVIEPVQGLTSARLAGIRATSGDAIVLFDDDNVPVPEYLHGVVRCLSEYPFVAVWGPGNIDVELLDPVPARSERRVKAHHGQKRNESVQYACMGGCWSTAYPHGMGQVIRRDVADAYRRAVESGALGATDRKGSSLASAGDNQIVWQAINMGLAAGLHPDLKLLHLIPARRTTIKYLRRMMFGCSVSYCEALAQSFPAVVESWRHNVPSSGRFGIQVSKVVMQSAVRNRLQFLSVDLAESLGELCGHMRVIGQENHWSLRLAKRLGLT